MGNLTRQLFPKRNRYVATDIDGEHLQRLQADLPHCPYLEVHICNLETELDFATLAGQMDSVVCLNVLEHVSNDLQGLRNMHSVLKSGGRAVILVPEGPGIYGTLDKVLGHYRRYSTEELRSKMQQIGFRVERIIEFNRISRPGWYLNAKILKKDEISPFQLKAFDRLVWLWRRIDGFLPWNPTSIIGIGVKD
jgi:SAM-dependent methyltransferase